jgi:hypothetical protein
MTALRIIFRHLWIGICALSMLAQTRLLLGLPLAPGWLDGFVPGGAVFAYGFTHPDRRVKTAAWLAGVFGGICFVLPLLSTPNDNETTATLLSSWQIATCVPAVLWLLYYGLRWPGNAGLRSVPAAKPFVVALAWAWVTVMLPVPHERWGEAAGILAGRSAFIFALALAYDLVDLDYDRQHGLKTLAARIGVRKTFLLIFSALLLAALCCCLNFLLHIYAGNMVLALCASLAFSAWWLWIVIEKTHWRGWQKVLIDALMVLQLAAVWAGFVMEK